MLGCAAMTVLLFFNRFSKFSWMFSLAKIYTITIVIHAEEQKYGDEMVHRNQNPPMSSTRFVVKPEGGGVSNVFSTIFD